MAVEAVAVLVMTSAVAPAVVAALGPEDVRKPVVG